MEQASRLRNAVGLCKKAGKLSSGDFAVEKLVRAGKAQLVLIDAQTSENTREKYAHLCTRMDVTLLSVAALGEAIGKPGRMLAAVTDEGFTDMIIRSAGETAADRNLRG